MNSNTSKAIDFITSDEIIFLHHKIIEETGGEFGVLNYGNLHFITDFITSQFYSMKITDIFYLSTIILRGIISGHPFVDGNKRTGIEATEIS